MKENFISFSSPIKLYRNFFIGFEVDNDSYQSPFGLVLNNKNSNDNAFYYDGHWHPYSSLSHYNKTTSLCIEPIIQTTHSSIRKKTPYKVFPNPVGENSLLSIEPLDEDSNKFSIFDMLGNKIEVNESFKDNSTLLISTNNLIPGVYILRIGNHSMRFLKN